MRHLKLRTYVTHTLQRNQTSRRDTKKTWGFPEENVGTLEASLAALPGISMGGSGLASGSTTEAHEMMECAVVGLPEPTASGRGNSTPESRGRAVGEFPGCAESLIP